MRSLVLLLAAAVLCTAESAGDTRIATWQDDRTATFLLMFDDGMPSAWQIAIPELHKRGMSATFYLNPGKAEFSKFPKEWEAVRQLGGMVFANHTMTHRGASTEEAGAKEIDDCQAALQQLDPGKWPRLISFGMPGVKEWKPWGDGLKAILARNNLIDRPPFNDHGAVYHLKTTAQMVALADKAIAAKGMEYLVIHGVERIVPDWKYQDFWALKQDVFFPLLDELKVRADRGDLWITDHISWHKYQAERSAASVRTTSDGHRLRIELTATTDPALYDLPLTLVTRVPVGWTLAVISQAGASSTVTVADGSVRYRALPGAGPIDIIAAP
jgi:peptidoglycan/xylan/chitin deacetylase (PgdA/CDA1 family)